MRKRQGISSLRAYQRTFAIFSVAIMILINFQVMTGDAQPDGIDLEPIINLDDANEPSSYDALNDTIDGSVDSFNDGSAITVSSLETLLPKNHMTEDRGNFYYWTANGTYVVNSSEPWNIALHSFRGTVLVSQSYFSILVKDQIMMVNDDFSVEANDHSLVVTYGLSDPFNNITIAKMVVYYDFADGVQPKITAEVVDVLMDIGDCSVVWAISPHKDAAVFDTKLEKTTVPLRDLPEGYVATDNKMKMEVEKDGFIIDWNDAKEGVLQVQSPDEKNGSATAGVLIVFPQGKKYIDPTLVCTSTNTDPLGVSCQRKVFWYDGYFWLFYNSGTSICYRNSANGVVWSPESALPQGTIPIIETGFDVAARGNLVSVCWYDTTDILHFKKGVLTGNVIQWSDQSTWVRPPGKIRLNWTVTTSIGEDNSYFVNFAFGDYFDQSLREQETYRSFSGDPGSFFRVGYWQEQYADWFWMTLLPTSNGLMAILNTDSRAVAREYVTVCQSSVNGWGTSIIEDIDLALGSAPGFKSQNISAVASSNGTVHIAYKGTDGNIRYACIYPSGGYFTSTIGIGLNLPTISLDANHILHVYYVVAGTQQTIYHKQKPEFGGSWSPSTLIYTGPSGQRIGGLTSGVNPVNVCSIAWSEDTGTTRNLKFASIPLPFGTAGAPSDPWNRDGLSPYGTYFGMNGGSVSPGNGLLTLTQTLVSIPGRAGSELGISIIYQQPKYFWTSNGSAYGNQPFPFCNLGHYWSLDLPWMDQYYVYLANGQRYIISWGNDGSPSEFVNHDGVHFVLKDSAKNGGFYELITSQGIRYRFEKVSPFKLVQISDLDNYNPASPTYTVPYNCLNLSYSGNLLSSIEESGLGRVIEFEHVGNLLHHIYRPDGERFTFSYSSDSNGVRLNSITDPLMRETAFMYNTNANNCLMDITFPTHGHRSITYVADTNSSTEMMTRMVASDALINNTYVRKATFDYKVVNGRVAFCKVSNFDETLTLKGTNEYIFQSAMSSSSETVKGPTGVQMSKKVTWYDDRGQPSRIDSYNGNSEVLNASVYMNYDDWGNAIYSRDALGHESYSSYANTSTSNSFQGGDVLTRTSTGKIFYDAFDDWDFADWTKSLSAGTATLDGSLDPSHAPAVKVSRTSATGISQVTHSFGIQTSPFYVQTSYRTESSVISYINGENSGNIRIYFGSLSGYFQYWNGVVWTKVAPCLSNTWYDVGFYVRYSNSTYDIYIDGKLMKCGATLTGSGYIDTIRFQAAESGVPAANIWFDNVRVYTGLTISLNGLDSRYTSIFNDAFDDWDFADWTKSLSAGTATLDGSLDPSHAPAVKVSRTSATGISQVTHSFNVQTSPFYIQTSYRTGSSVISYINGENSGNIRIYFGSLSGYFQYWNGAVWTKVAPCLSNTWYDVGFYVRYSNSTYDIYINGQLMKCGATLTGSGYIDTIRFQAAESGVPAANIWFDNVRVYTGPSFAPNGLDSSYVCEIFDSKGVLLDRNRGGTLTFQSLPVNAPPAYIRVTKVGNGSFSMPMSDVWGGDVYALSNCIHISGLPKVVRGFGQALDGINNDVKPVGSIEYASVSDGQSDLIWVDDAVTGSDFSISGTKYHRSGYYSYSYPTHYHGFNGTTSGMAIVSGDILTQYVWLEEGMLPSEIAINVYANNAWRMAYWGGSPDDFDIQWDGTTFNPTVTYYCGDVPTITGQWLQLTVKASNLSITSGTITGVMYALYGGTARWELTSIYPNGVVINGLTSGYKVKMTLENGTVIQGTASSSSLRLVLYDAPAVVRSYPVSATFEVQDGNGNTLYLSPAVSMIHNGDQFTYSPNNFYLNKIKDGIHSAPVGTLTYQDSLKTVPQASYLKYDAEGNCIETRSNLGAGWVYSRNGYDKYGNLLWSADPTGRMSVTEYSAADSYTLPVSTSAGDRVDFFDFDATWTSVKSGSGGYNYWMTAQYSSSISYSPSKSLEVSFENGPSGFDTCTATVWKEFQSNRVDKISLKLFVESYYHNGNSGDTMDSGLKMYLYDSSGTSYALYTYWLACWSGSTNNKTVSNPSITKCIWGKPATNTWLNPALYPNSDFNIDWSQCVKVRFEIYTYGSWAFIDEFRMYVDDLTFNDLTSAKSSYDHDHLNSWVTSATDPLGHTSHWQYDEIGRVIYQENPDYTNSYTLFDDSANKATVYDELRRKSVVFFDRLGREMKAERYGTGSVVYSVTKKTYNWQDQVATATDEMNRVVTYTYDYLGRVTSVKNPDNTISYTTYDDRNKLVTALDELGHKTVSVFDDLGRLNQTREYITASAFYVTRMAYNAVGQLVTVRQDNGEVTRMSYDTLGRQTSIAYPDAKSESYAYDEAGRVLTATSRSGQVTTSAYDTAGNNIRVTGGGETIRTRYNADGLVSEKVNSLGNISYHYDSRDRLYRTVQKVSPNTYTFTYAYNAVGDVVYVDYPDARRITYLYDRYGRAVDVKMGNTLLLNVTYNPDDSVASKRYCDSNCSVTYTYKTNGMVGKIKAVNVSSGVTILDLNYDFTADGDVSSIKDAFGSAGNEYYWYDSLGRLTKAMANSTFGTIQYGYSSVGNRIWKNEGTNVSSTYTTYNKLTLDGTYSYVYDANGNVFWKNSSAVRYNYIYNAFGQMTEVRKQLYSGGWGALTTVARYYYDANGARAKTEESGTITRYIYAGHDPIYFNSSDGRGQKDIYLSGGLDLRVVSAGESYVYISDALGSTRFVLRNGNKNIQDCMSWAVTYKPFGQIYSPAGTDKFSYTGEIVDSPTGLVYLSARYMDPSTGRFMALDPELGHLSMPQTLNRYVYCANSPLIHTDPTGAFLDTIFDVACLAWDIVELWNDPTPENWGWTAVDVVCTAVPFLPAIGGLVKVGKIIDKGFDAERAADKALDGEKAVERAKDLLESRRMNDAARAPDLVGHLGKSEIMPYGELQKIPLPKGMERHKLLEWRVAKNLGFKSMKDVPAVALTHADHNTITQMLRGHLPYGSKYVDEQVQGQLRGIYAGVYGEGSEWFRAISPYLP